MDAEIDPDALADLLERDEPVRVVDIRPTGSFARGHIPGSENVPFQRLPREVETFAGAERIVTVCPHGKSSIQAARLVASYEGCADARVESLAGGLDAWGERYELVSGAEQAGTESSGPDSSDGPASPF